MTKKKDGLNAYITAYGKEFKYSLDNDLILNFYPHRVTNKMVGNSLLELGIGHGYTTKIFSKKVRRHVVIEGSQLIIDKFKKDFGPHNVDIIHHYFEDFMTDEKFDNIVMGFVLEHVDNPGLILKKFSRFLKKNGKIFVAVPNSEALNRRLGYHAGLLDRLESLSDSDRALGHKRYFNLKMLNALAKKSGLVAHSVEGLFLKPITTNQIQQLKLGQKVLDAMMKVGIDYPQLSTGILMELGIA
jgi:2-polyprenyl-3-methyl-5-hydroxy-6-metoxy-1,4-benzoquinol methylase